MSTPTPAVYVSENVQQHESALRSFLSRRFSSLPDHDDLVQETFVRLLRITDLNRFTCMRALLFTTARNIAIDHIRRTQRSPIVPIDEVAEVAMLDPTPGAAEACDHSQRREAILHALDELPERCRKVMLMRYVNGFSTKEIAEQLNLAPATVRVHLMNGLRDCTQFFRKRNLLNHSSSEKGEY